MHEIELQFYFPDSYCLASCRMVGIEDRLTVNIFKSSILIFNQSPLVVEEVICGEDKRNLYISTTITNVLDR